MQKMWNVTRELIRRERDTRETFDKERCSSFFEVISMKISHFTEYWHLDQVSPKKVRFCPFGNILVMFYGYDDEILISNVAVIWDWKDGTCKSFLKYFDDDFTDIRFFKREQDIHIITVLSHGRLDKIVQANTKTTYFTHSIPKERQYLAIFSLNFDQVYSACESGRIFKINLKDSQAETLEPATVVISHTTGEILSLSGISHHPLQPEVCVACSDSCLRIYDTKNLEKPLKTLSLKTKNESLKILNFSYNWNGSEILVTYSDNKAYLFTNDSNITKSTEIPNSELYKNLQFLARGSNYLVGIQDSTHLCLLEKTTGLEVKRITVESDIELLSLEVHSNLPVFAALTKKHGALICTPEVTLLEPYHDLSPENGIINANQIDEALSTPERKA